MRVCVAGPLPGMMTGMAEKVERSTGTGGAQATAGQVRGRRCDIFPVPETTCCQDGVSRLGGV